ncbi:kinesin-domain-containing protein [Choiromyces venosus 120613-1]|uniref:Kinesin-domain-containing protein n=1 Tax=Choiromyces venosus 120613-1 TaxID=1336337 RepID=A0A3N4JW17_9PEZI|nr:kinesin-domain-containing protein [Choiromyces venosus 120613-1]
MKDSQTVLIPPPGATEKGAGSKAAKDGGPKVFNFDRSYWSFAKSDPNYAGQENLFDDLGRPLLDNAFEGYNNCIFAYGQTGSGKSYSMMGYGEEYGVIPKICQHMFERITTQQMDPNLKCTVEVSYLEIYNERVRDLLNPSTKGNLKVREHPSLGPYVEDLAKLVVSSFSEIEHLMDEGNKARTVAATNMNETSSRSHAVFTLILSQKRHDVETGFDTEKVSRISLVDLAGSERATSTGATGARLKEGAEINRSLSTLGRVIAALADLSSGKKKNANMVPYRDSILTWLLKDSLGGNSMTAMIAAISPADINFDETLSTLRYADSAKRIKNHAVVNEDPNARMIRELKEELQQLRQKLSGGGSMPEENYAPDTPLEKQMVTITTPDGQVKKVSKAEIAEQLNASEKLLGDLNQTWEERLEKTQQIHKEREAALEELGISIEKGFVGLSTPKKIPHLVNLSDDPLLAECLVYNIKSGTTLVGNVETSTTAQIRLNGSKILTDHCRFENENGVVTLIPNQKAAVMVNGLRIDGPRRLRTGYRIILGDFHIFRFNHPQEARAERDKLRQSATMNSDHRHSLSNGMTIDVLERAESETNGSRPDSPAMVPANSREIDWSFAQREAEEMRHRNIRRGRPDSRLDSIDDETESVMSFPGIREKYASIATLDELSLDTMITMPGTPQQGEVEERLRLIKDEMQIQLEKQKEEYQQKLKATQEAHVEIEAIKAEKIKMQEKLELAKKEMQEKLELQRQEYQSRLEEISLSPPKTRDPEDGLTDIEKKLARFAFDHWRKRRYVRMAESILQHAAILKEAQIMSNEMEKFVVFQFTIVDEGHTFQSSYDLVLNGVSAEDDEFLDMARKPCVGVRVMDFDTNVVHLWSLEKLQNRVGQMRQIYQYLDRPEYLQHLRLRDPFSEPTPQQYSLVGDVDVPLTAIFESRSQDFVLDVTSPHTASVVGIIKLALEPSPAEAPSSTLKFNVVMRELQGFAEREGTSVHAQMFIPGISDESGATTTDMITDFDEGPVKFGSTHPLSMPLGAPLRNTALRVAIFAKITSMHLEKLISWDDMRDHKPTSPQKKRNARLNETEFYTEEKHDVFSRVQILELSESGDYLPVEVIQQSDTDPGLFQLRQGLQRRVQLSLTHNSGDALQWSDITQLRISQVRLLDPRGKTPDMSSPTREIKLNTVLGPVVKQNSDGTGTIGIVAQWDSSLHNSIYLDRTTADKYRVQMNLRWNVVSDKLSEPIAFSQDVFSQVQPRILKSPNKFMQLWNNNRIMHASVGLFQLVIRPAAARRAGDLWRMNTMHRYVKGEEYLGEWTPRGVSLVRDFLRAKQRRIRAAEVENAKGFLSSLPVTRNVTPKPGAGEPLAEMTREVPREAPPQKSTSSKATESSEGMDEEIGGESELADSTVTTEVVQEPPPTGVVLGEDGAPEDSLDRTPEDTPIDTPAESSEGGSDSSPGGSRDGSRQGSSEGDPAEAPEGTLMTESITGEDAAIREEDPHIHVLRRYVDLWSSWKDPSENILVRRNTEPPQDAACFAEPTEAEPPRLIAEVRQIPKSTSVLKSGYLFMPDESNKAWIKRYFELRRPYLHVHSISDGEEMTAINLTHCRIERSPNVRKLLRKQNNMFAVYTPLNAYLFGAKSERDMIEWILKIDQSHFDLNTSRSNTPADEERVPLA